MEASKFGFGDDASSGYKFDPTDADIVAFYLLPRALGLRHPYDHAIIDDDPVSLPPWELLHKHAHADSDHAFFFGPATDKTKNGGRKERAVEAGAGGGGTWRGQKSVEESLTLLGPGERELDIKYKRYSLTYYRTGTLGTTGWVMHEYEITSPPLPYTVLSRIRITDRGKTKQQQQAEAMALAADADPKVLPDLEQPGPSRQYHAGNAVVTGDGEGFSGVLARKHRLSMAIMAVAWERWVATTLLYTTLGRETSTTATTSPAAVTTTTTTSTIHMYYDANGDIKYEPDDGHEYGN